MPGTQGPSVRLRHRGGRSRSAIVKLFGPNNYSGQTLRYIGVDLDDMAQAMSVYEL